MEYPGVHFILTQSRIKNGWDPDFCLVAYPWIPGQARNDKGVKNPLLLKRIELDVDSGED